MVIQVNSPCSEAAKLGHHILSSASPTDGIKVKGAQVEVHPATLAGAGDQRLIGRILYPASGTIDQVSKLDQVGPVVTRGGAQEAIGGCDCCITVAIE